MDLSFVYSDLDLLSLLDISPFADYKSCSDTNILKIICQTQYIFQTPNPNSFSIITNIQPRFSMKGKKLSPKIVSSRFWNMFEGYTRWWFRTKNGKISNIWPKFSMNGMELRTKNNLHEILKSLGGINSRWFGIANGDSLHSGQDWSHNTLDYLEETGINRLQMHLILSIQWTDKCLVTLFKRSFK